MVTITSNGGGFAPKVSLSGIRTGLHQNLKKHVGKRVTIGNRTFQVNSQTLKRIESGQLLGDKELAWVLEQDPEFNEAVKKIQQQERNQIKQSSINIPQQKIHIDQNRTGPPVIIQGPKPTYSTIKPIKIQEKSIKTLVESKIPKDGS